MLRDEGKGNFEFPVPSSAALPGQVSLPGSQVTFPNQTLTLQQTLIREPLLPLVIKAFVNPRGAAGGCSQRGEE